MGYLTIIKNKGYPEYIDDVIRGIEAEEQLRLTLEENTRKPKTVNPGKIALICFTLIVSIALIVIALNIIFREDSREQSINTSVQQIEEISPTEEDELLLQIASSEE